MAPENPANQTQGQTPAIDFTQGGLLARTGANHAALNQALGPMYFAAGYQEAGPSVAEAFDAAQNQWKGQGGAAPARS